MKKLLLTTTCFLFMGQIAFSQCTQMIYPEPAFTKIVTDTSFIAELGGGYWICSGLTVTINGSAGSAYYCEENVTLIVTATDGDQVFAKPGCSITNSSDGEVNVTANFSTITTSNTGTGTLTTVLNCTDLIYDYTLVGGTGGPCASSSLSTSDLQTLDVVLFPNPVNQGTDFYLSKGNVAIRQLHITTLSGAILTSISGDIHTVSTAGIAPGNYLIQVDLEDNAQQILRIVVR